MKTVDNNSFSEGDPQDGGTSLLFFPSLSLGSVYDTHATFPAPWGRQKYGDRVSYENGVQSAKGLFRKV